MPVGIDDIALHIPRLFLDMRDFAALREMNAEKLRRGLGLEAMSLPDVHEDAATMGANAVARLIERNTLDPRTIGRLYLGTESALDGAKPTATYILGMLTERFGPRYGADCFQHCDVVDLTFACIGAVDALHNTLDWVRGSPDRVGIAVFADHARYERNSPGEYTQGAGGGALLVRHDPRLLVIDDLWGVCTTPVHDFFKPRRRVAARSLFEQVLSLAEEVGAEIPEGLARRMEEALPDSPLAETLFHEEHAVQLHRDTPTFDGPLSNRCYVRALTGAMDAFRRQARAKGRLTGDAPLTDSWRRIAVHLPYALQGRRMFPDLWAAERLNEPDFRKVLDEVGLPPLPADSASEEAHERACDAYRRQLSRTEAYRAFAAERLDRGHRASALVGNQYTGSVFLALLSTLHSDHADGVDLVGERIGLCAYGSGAKAKVFEGTVQPGWREVIAGEPLFERLQHRVKLTTGSYEALHRGHLTRSIAAPAAEFVLDDVGEDGARRYRWVA